MARAPVGQIPLSAQLNPVATPVDTFVTPEKSPLRDVADALGVADKGLQTWVQTRDRKAEQDSLLQGQARIANEGEDGDFAKLVSSGKIPAQYNPYYVRGAKNAIGAAAGDRLTAGWQDYWDNLPDSTKLSDDPKAVPNAIQTYLKGKMGTDDPDILKGLLPTVQALQSNALVTATAYKHEKTVSGRVMAGGAVVASGVSNALADGLTAAGGTDYPALFQRANDGIADTLKDGDPGDKGKNTFIDVMGAKILDEKDPALLDWFDSKVPGTDIKWGDTPHGLEVKLATKNALETSAHSVSAAATAEQARADKVLKDAAMTSLSQAIFKDPRAPLDENMLQQAEKHGEPTIRSQVTTWRDNALKGIPSDPDKVQQVYSAIIDGGDPMATLRDAMSHEVFTSTEDLSKAAAFAQSFKDKQDVIEKSLGSFTSKSLMEAMRTRTIGMDQLGSPLTGTSNEGFEAQSDYKETLSRWILANPNATPQEIDEQSSKIGSSILKNFKEGDSISTPGTYERPADMPFPNAFDSKDEKPAEDPNADITDYEKKNDITPENKKTLTDAATKAGMSYEEYMRGRIMKPLSGPSGGTVQKTSFDATDPDMGEGDASGHQLTPEQATKFIDQAFAGSNDDGVAVGGGKQQVKGLLDLVAGGEGSGSNYNAIYGKADSQIDLSKLTLDQVMGAQQYARKQGMPSTAIGRYQIIAKTMRSLRQDLDLDGTEKFTPELQDQLGEALLKRRGLDDFRAGRISKGQFAKSLSQEWASLPDPNTGRSFYDGDGLNAAGVSRSSVYAALGQKVSFGPNSGGNFSGTNADGYDPQTADAPVQGLKWTGRTQKEVDGLAIHHTGGRETPEQVVATLNKRGLGVQYIMDRDGKVYQTAPDGARFAHIKNSENGSGLSNDNAVGIEVIANDDSDITPAQKIAGAKWIEKMRGKYPTIGENVFGHGELNPGHKEATEGMTIVNQWRHSHKPSNETDA